jgi:hypothetical protein
MYLGLQNMAAIDLTNKLRKLCNNAPNAVVDDLHAQMGSIAAPLVIVWRGMINVLCQILFCWCAGKTGLRLSGILAVSLIVPSVALICLVPILSLDVAKVPAVDLIPAFYWDNTDAGQHRFSFTIHIATGIWYLSSSLIVKIVWSLPLERRNQLGRMVNWFFNALPAIHFVLQIIWIVLYSLGINQRMTWSETAIMWSPILAVPAGITFIICPLGLLFVEAFGFLDYLPNISSTSCYFMPCTLHSIWDMDQAFTLVASLTIFLGFGVWLPMYRKGYTALIWNNIRRRISPTGAEPERVALLSTSDTSDTMDSSDSSSHSGLRRLILPELIEQNPQYTSPA